MPKGYWLAHVDIHNPEGYQPYIANNAAIFKKFGGRFVVRGGQFEAPEGTARSRNIVIEFPDYATALTCYRSPISSSSRATTARSPEASGSTSSGDLVRECSGTVAAGCTLNCVPRFAILCLPFHNGRRQCD
jgi:uncharacterized protein (DUF1330 family)